MIEANGNLQKTCCTTCVTSTTCCTAVVVDFHVFRAAGATRKSRFHIGVVKTMPLPFAVLCVLAVGRSPFAVAVAVNIFPAVAVLCDLCGKAVGRLPFSEPLSLCVAIQNARKTHHTRAFCGYHIKHRGVHCRSKPYRRLVGDLAEEPRNATMCDCPLMKG